MPPMAQHKNKKADTPLIVTEYTPDARYAATAESSRMMGTMMEWGTGQTYRMIKR